MHHINLLELTAGAFVIKTFARQRRNIHMHLKMDNKTAIFSSTRWGELDHISLPTQFASCGMVPPTGDHIISRTSAWVQQHHSRSRVSASSLLSGVDAQQGDIQLDNGGPGPMSIGSVCNSTQPPVELVFELEARAICTGDRCLLHQLEGQRRICLPTIFPNREMPPESTRRATLV